MAKKGYNKIILLGNLTRDPEMVKAKGMKIASFDLAVNNCYRDKTTVDYIRCKAFGKLADICEEFLGKGDSVFLDGRLSVQSYTDKQGQKKVATEVIAENLVRTGGKRDAVTEFDEMDTLGNMTTPLFEDNYSGDDVKIPF